MSKYLGVRKWMVSLLDYVIVTVCKEVPRINIDVIEIFCGNIIVHIFVNRRWKRIYKL